MGPVEGCHSLGTCSGPQFLSSSQPLAVKPLLVQRNGSSASPRVPPSYGRTWRVPLRATPHATPLCLPGLFLSWVMPRDCVAIAHSFSCSYSKKLGFSVSSYMQSAGEGGSPWVGRGLGFCPPPSLHHDCPGTEGRQGPSGRLSCPRQSIQVRYPLSPPLTANRRKEDRSGGRHSFHRVGTYTVSLALALGGWGHQEDEKPPLIPLETVTSRDTV